jgi:ZIP family zinc transporter
MDGLVLVLLLSALAAALTWLGGAIADYADVPKRFVSRALHFAGGVLMGLVALSLLAPAVQIGPVLPVLGGVFVGGTVFVIMDFILMKRQQAQAEIDAQVTPLTLYVGVLIDMFIDGILIGIGSALTLAAGLALTLSISISTAPLALVSIATAKRQGRTARFRRLLGVSFAAAIMTGAALGFLFVRDQSVLIKLVIVSIGAGFLLMTVTQSIIPEANRDGEPSLAALLFISGLSLYALIAVLSIA